MEDADIDGGVQEADANHIASDGDIEAVANEESSDREPVKPQTDPRTESETQASQRGQPPKVAHAPPEMFRRRVISYDD
jgi:hypothetical protein